MTETVYRKRSFKEIKQSTIKAAKELFYSEEVIEKLKKAKTEGELGLIMTTARKRKE